MNKRTQPKTETRVPGSYFFGRELPGLHNITIHLVFFKTCANTIRGELFLKIG